MKLDILSQFFYCQFASIHCALSLILIKETKTTMGYQNEILHEDHTC